MIHEPIESKRVIKIDSFAPFYVGACSCGWVSPSPQPKEGWANKQSKGHAKSKAAVELQQALAQAEADFASGALTPQMVRDAVHTLNSAPEHNVPLTTAWEHGITAISVWSGEGGTAAIRYTLSADLTEIIEVGRITSKYKRKW